MGIQTLCAAVGGASIIKLRRDDRRPTGRAGADLRIKSFFGFAPVEGLGCCRRLCGVGGRLGAKSAAFGAQCRRIARHVGRCGIGRVRIAEAVAEVVVVRIVVERTQPPNRCARDGRSPQPAEVMMVTARGVKRRRRRTMPAWAAVRRSRRTASTAGTKAVVRARAAAAAKASERSDIFCSLVAKRDVDSRRTR